jgi:hypothetical protein
MKASSSTNAAHGSTLLDRKRTLAKAVRSEASPSVSLAVLSAIDEEGRPWISFPHDASRTSQPARSVCVVGPADLGREAVLSFEGGDLSKPIILGLLQPAPAAALPTRLSADGEEVTLSAAKQIVLQCGKASITLTRAGKVLIRGAYVSTRSSGVNRIKGGSVQIN